MIYDLVRIQSPLILSSNPFEDSVVLLTLLLVDLLAFFGRGVHQLDAWVVLQLFFGHLSEHAMGRQMLHVPIVELLNIGYAIQSPFRFEEISVFAEEARIDDAASEIFCLEMRVSEANKDFGK